MKNFYWPIYINLEREFLDIAKTIHIDDNQLGVYSMRICDMLVRTVVEIESISKDLFFDNGGVLPGDQDFPYFDTDCIKLLVDKWSINKKVVLVVSPDLYLEKDENIILIPFHKAHKRGTSGSDWEKAYQKVKHDRARQFQQGNVKVLLRALAALFLLNIYYRDDKLDLGHDRDGTKYDLSLGSKLFAIKCHGGGAVVTPDGSYVRGDDFDECVYLSIPDSVLYKSAVEQLKRINEEALQMAIPLFENELNKQSDPVRYFSNEGAKRIGEIKSRMLSEVIKKHRKDFARAVMELTYDGILNKNQF